MSKILNEYLSVEEFNTPNVWSLNIFIYAIYKFENC